MLVTALSSTLESGLSLLRAFVVLGILKTAHRIRSSSTLRTRSRLLLGKRSGSEDSLPVHSLLSARLLPPNPRYRRRLLSSSMA